MEDHSRRIRILFKDDILSETQKSEGLNRSWVLLKPNQNATVSDISSHLLRAFQLHKSCPHGLLLSISGFVLPPFESVGILKDDEIISVRKREVVLAIEGNDAGNEVGKLKGVLGKRRVDDGVLLLANEEFEKEKGGYESDSEDEEEEGVLLEDIECGIDADFQNRKRKATEKLQVSKKKRQRTEASGSGTKDVLTEKVVNGGQAEDITKKEEKKKPDSNAEDKVENNEESFKLSDKNDASVPGKKGSDEVQANGKETEDAKVATKETKKVPSRSARRKYAKRKWLQEMAKIRKTNATCESEGLKNWKEDQAKAGKTKVDGQSEGWKNWKEDQAKAGKDKVDDQLEGWRSWKDDQAKAGKNRVDNQSEGRQKWKKQRADANNAEVDGQPKGLLHWKQSFQNSNSPVRGQKRQKWNRDNYVHRNQRQNGDVHEQKTQNSGGREQPTQISDELEQANKKNVEEQPSQANGGVDEHPNKNGDEQPIKENVVLEEHSSKPGDEHPTKENSGVDEHPNKNGDEEPTKESDDDEETEVVPIVIRPGHIRFEPLEKEEAAAQKNHAPVETSQWNGITSKKKGQQWGKEDRSFTPRNDHKNSNKEYSEIPSTEKEKQPGVKLDFDKLPPLPSTPKEGDLIAYRVLELSSTWTPELSAFRVGKVSWFETHSNQTLLVPVPEYPLVPENGDDDEAAQLDSSLYKEDGTLEIDFLSLIDVRIVKNGSPVSGNGERAPKNVLPTSNDQQTVLPGPEDGEINEGEETQPPTTGENDGGSLWDQVSEALSAKKEQLAKENGWGKSPKKLVPVQPSSYENSWGKNPKKVQQPSSTTPPRNKWGKQQQQQQNSSGGGNKSWSYRALRGSALGPTMAMLRSKKDT